MEGDNNVEYFVLDAMRLVEYAFITHLHRRAK